MGAHRLYGQLPQSDVDGLTAALAAKATDADTVHQTGAETINGVKTFGSAPQVPVGALMVNPVRRDDARLTDARPPTGHAASHAVGAGDDLSATYVPWVNVAAAGGVASLDGAGKIPQGQLPAIALTEFLGAVASQAAMLALTGQRGDWATRTDLGVDYQLIAEPSTTLGSWRAMTYPASPVSSVNGRAGVVTGLAEQSSLASHTGDTANPHAVTKSQVGLGSADNTADTAKPVSAAAQTALDLKLNRAVSVRTITAATTLLDADDVVVCDTTTAAFTVTLPSAVGRTGRSFLIKKIGPNALTIATTSSQTIDGVTTEPISMAYGFREVISNGGGWYVRGGKVDPVIAALADTAAAATLTVNAAAATIYRGRLTGSTATLAAPTNPVDGDQINLELYATVACSLTVASAVVLTAGITSPIAVPANKLLTLGLRYRAATNPATSTAAWRLLASAPDA